LEKDKEVEEKILTVNHKQSSGRRRIVVERKERALKQDGKRPLTNLYLRIQKSSAGTQSVTLRAWQKKEYYGYRRPRIQKRDEKRAKESSYKDRERKHNLIEGKPG